MKKAGILTVLVALAVLPRLVFAFDLAGPLRPIDIIWYMVAFCVFVILLILHHLMIQQKQVRRATTRR